MTQFFKWAGAILYWIFLLAMVVLPPAALIWWILACAYFPYLK